MIIQLESEKESIANEELARLIHRAIDTQDDGLIAYIRKLWNNEPWQSIVTKFNTNSSVWYCWWWDGVRVMIALDEEEVTEYAPYTCREDRQI